VAYPWFEVYRAAVLELDTRKILDRIETARSAIKDRLRFSSKLTKEECYASADALICLQILEDTEVRISRAVGA
jgi:hypothetical protein